MLLITGFALASTPVTMDWVEQSATDAQVAYEVSLYGLGEDVDGDGLIDEVSLFYQVTTLVDGQTVLREEGLVQVDSTPRAYADADAGRTIALKHGLLVLDHGDGVAVAGGEVWLFDNE